MQAVTDKVGKSKTSPLREDLMCSSFEVFQNKGDKKKKREMYFYKLAYRMALKGAKQKREISLPQPEEDFSMKTANF